jgi:hypothetical protein
MTASAAIGLGIRIIQDLKERTQTTENVAWILGEDPCRTQVYINQADSTPCDTAFTLKNSYTRTEQIYRGSYYSLANGNGLFNSNCVGYSSGYAFVCQINDVASTGYPSDFIVQGCVCG